MNLSTKLQVAHKKLLDTPAKVEAPTVENLGFEPSPIPKQEMTELQSGAKAEEAKKTLFFQQQTMLAKLRAKVVSCDASGLRDISGKLHVATWNELELFFKHMAGMGEYSGLFVFGGWGHNGDMRKLSAVPTEIIDLMQRFRKTCEAGRLLKRANSKDRQYDLAAYIRNNFPEWSDLDKVFLKDALLAEQRQLSLSLEAALLFLQTRVFAFAPTAADPCGGWKDFLWFVNSYRLMEKRFAYVYEDYFWGWYHPMKKAQGDGSSVGNNIRAAPVTPRGGMEID